MQEAPGAIFAHIRELRRRVLVSMTVWAIGFACIYALYTPFMTWFMAPFSAAGHADLIITSVFEGFVTKMKFSALGGLVFTFPFHLYQLLRFAFPGLSPREKKVVLSAVIFGGLLAILSLILSYIWLIPFTLATLTSDAFIPDSVRVLLHFEQNMFYVINMLLYGMLAFQFPIILTLMLFFGWVTRRQLLAWAKYVMVGIVIVSAIVTPPDVVSQLGVAIPLAILYFASIFVAKIFGWGKG